MKRTMILAVAACTLLPSCALYDTAARCVGMPEHEEIMAGGRVASPMMMAAPENEYQALMWGEKKKLMLQLSKGGNE